MPGVVGYVDRHDVPGSNMTGMILQDEPIFAEDEVGINCYLLLVRLGINASATAKIISRRRNIDHEMSVSLVQETGVSGGNYLPQVIGETFTSSNLLL